MMESNGVKSEKLNFRLPFVAHERLRSSSLYFVCDVFVAVAVAVALAVAAKVP